MLSGNHSGSARSLRRTASRQGPVCTLKPSPNSLAKSTASAYKVHMCGEDVINRRARVVGRHADRSMHETVTTSMSKTKRSSSKRPTAKVQRFV